jgi:hypothetical protein
LLGTWGVARAYRGAVRFCQQGETTPSTPGKAAATAVPNGRTILVERRLPVVSEEVAGMALAMFRSLLRAPEVKMSVATNILIFAVVGAGILMRTGHSIPEQAQPFVAAAAVAMTFLGLTQLMFNQFGFDRNGFRAIVLVPSPRSSVLLGKNLAVLPVAMVIFSVCIGVAAVLGHLKAWVLLATAFEFAVAFFVLCIFGNLASILVPYRIAAGSLKPTKLKAFTHLFIFITHALFPAALLPVFVPAGVGLLGEMLWSLPFAVTTIGCAALLAAVMALLYWKTLPPTGRLLQRRERAILQVVTHEIE